MNKTEKHAERSKKGMYLTFIEEYIDFKNNKKFMQRTLTKWIREYLRWKEIPFSEKRSTDDIFLFLNPNIQTNENFSEIKPEINSKPTQSDLAF